MNKLKHCQKSILNWPSHMLVLEKGYIYPPSPALLKLCVSYGNELNIYMYICVSIWEDLPSLD